MPKLSQKYNLQDFKNWLEVHNIPKSPWNWENHLKEFENKPQKFVQFIEEAVADERGGEFEYYDDVVNSAYRWKREIERTNSDSQSESEAEEEQKKKKTRDNWSLE